MSSHQNSTLIHVIHNYTYANAAARTGAAGFVAGDIGKVARQTDNNTYYILTATTPTWQQIGAGSVTIQPSFTLIWSRIASLAGSADNTIETPGNATLTEVVAPCDCKLVGISVALSSVRTAGTLIVKHAVNGVIDSTNVATIDGTNTQYHSAAIFSGGAISRGARITCIATTSGFTPTTVDLVVCMLFERTA